MKSFPGSSGDSSAEPAVRREGNDKLAQRLPNQRRSREGQDLIDFVPYNRLFEIVDKRRIARVVDIGCHRGEHIQMILRPHFPDAEIVGIEPKDVNYGHCRTLNLPGTQFLQLDCRSLNRGDVGQFDFVWCAGLIYHLDDPTLLMKSLASITHATSFVCVEGHVAVDAEQMSLPDPNPPIIERELDGQVYRGKMYAEFAEDTPREERDQLHLASVDNPWAFWLTFDSAVQMFRRYGFEHVVELRSDSLKAQLGQDTCCTHNEDTRRWARCFFLMSRSPLEVRA